MLVYNLCVESLMLPMQFRMATATRQVVRRADLDDARDSNTIPAVEVLTKWRQDIARRVHHSPRVDAAHLCREGPKLARAISPLSSSVKHKAKGDG